MTPEEILAMIQQGLGTAGAAPAAGGVQAQAPPVIPGVGFRWGGRIMRSPEEAVAFARARGLHLTVQQFLARHPHIAAIFPHYAVAAARAGAHRPVPPVATARPV